MSKEKGISRFFRRKSSQSEPKLAPHPLNEETSNVVFEEDGPRWTFYKGPITSGLATIATSLSTLSETVPVNSTTGAVVGGLTLLTGGLYGVRRYESAHRKFEVTETELHVEQVKFPHLFDPEIAKYPLANLNIEIKQNKITQAPFKTGSLVFDNAGTGEIDLNHVKDPRRIAKIVRAAKDEPTKHAQTLATEHNRLLRENNDLQRRTYQQQQVIIDLLRGLQVPNSRRNEEHGMTDIARNLEFSEKSKWEGLLGDTVNVKSFPESITPEVAERIKSLGFEIVFMPDFSNEIVDREAGLPLSNRLFKSDFGYSNSSEQLSRGKWIAVEKLEDEQQSDKVLSLLGLEGRENPSWYEVATAHRENKGDLLHQVGLPGSATVDMLTAYEARMLALRKGNVEDIYEYTISSTFAYGDNKIVAVRNSDTNGNFTYLNPIEHYSDVRSRTVIEL